MAPITTRWNTSRASGWIPSSPNKEKMPPLEALRIIRACAEALQHSHARAVIHRDIKPANIMLTPDGGVKLMDFGIAKVLDATRMTETLSVLGTVEYMSPEQSQGRHVDAHSDLYSLGVVLYQCLTARVPISGTTPTEVIMKLRTHQIEPPSAWVAGTAEEPRRAGDAPARARHVETARLRGGTAPRNRTRRAPDQGRRRRPRADRFGRPRPAHRAAARRRSGGTRGRSVSCCSRWASGSGLAFRPAPPPSGTRRRRAGASPACGDQGLDQERPRRTRSTIMPKTSADLLKKHWRGTKEAQWAEEQLKKIKEARAMEAAPPQAPNPADTGESRRRKLPAVSETEAITATKS